MKRMIRTTGEALFLSILIFFGLIAFAHAENEIHYGGVEKAFDDKILIEYGGPSGEERFLCSLDTGECNQNEKEGNLLPEAATDVGSIVSNDGHYALKVTAYDFGGIAHVYYSLYDVSGEKNDFLALIPFYGLAKEKMFTTDGKSIVFITGDAKLLKYDIASGNMSQTGLSGTDLPFWALSPSGEYASSYNYVTDAHRIYNLETGATEEVPANEPGYVVFSNDGSRAAYKVDAGNFDALKTVSLGGAAGQGFVGTPETVLDDESVIEDYIFVDGNLYFMTNSEHPLVWSIYEYDFETGETKKIAEDVSYGQFMKKQDGKLLYQKVKGKNANIVAYNSETDENTVYEPVGASPVTDAVTRQAVKLESGRYGVLISPKEDANGKLFIWLHGGPMRQTSIGYHSYLSYAVYDELLERLAVAGAHVLKLDYTGSFGYGEEMLDGLEKKVGVVDVRDVVSAAKEMEGELDIDDIYLIGNSYGGYLSLKSLVEKEDLFDGAVSISGVTDWYSLINRIPSSPFIKLFNGTPDLSNLDAYMDASIYKDIPDLDEEKELLVVYGLQDTLVPTWQSRDFVSFAKTFDVDVRDLIFEDEGHILRKRESLNQLCEAVVERFDLEEVECKL